MPISGSACVVAVVFLFGLGACAPQGLYYWGDYSQALYDYQQDPTALSAYRTALEDIVEKSDKRPIPPGIQAELGYLVWLEGDPSAAADLFRAEKASWPESAHFMDRAIDLTEGKEETPVPQPAAAADDENVQEASEAEVLTQ